MRPTVIVLAVAFFAVGCGASVPKQSSAVPFARNFVLAVFQQRVSCTSINRWVRASDDGECAYIHSLPHYYLTDLFPSSVRKCNTELPDYTFVDEQCIDFQVIARLRNPKTSDWSLGTLYLSVGKDSQGRLVEDGVGFEGGDCFDEAQCLQLWRNRVTP